VLCLKVVVVVALDSAAVAVVVGLVVEVVVAKV
jgi:hypothetical protein